MAPTQLNIFNHSGLHTTVRDIKESINAEVKASGKSRDQVLDRANELAKRHHVVMNGKGELSKDLFEKWINPEDESRVPSIRGLMVICAALETVKPLDVMAIPMGGRVIGPEEVKLLEWAKRYQQTRVLRKQMRKLEEEL